ncbi:hypothetical protein AOLI_G00091480 [Acnodon oligacanthus]
MNTRTAQVKIYRTSSSRCHSQPSSVPVGQATATDVRLQGLGLCFLTDSAADPLETLYSLTFLLEAF